MFEREQTKVYVHKAGSLSFYIWLLTYFSIPTHNDGILMLNCRCLQHVRRETNHMHDLSELKQTFQWTKNLGQSLDLRQKRSTQLQTSLIIKQLFDLTQVFVKHDKQTSQKTARIYKPKQRYRCLFWLVFHGSWVLIIQAGITWVIYLFVPR